MELGTSKKKYSSCSFKQSVNYPSRDRSAHASIARRRRRETDRKYRASAKRVLVARREEGGCDPKLSLLHPTDVSRARARTRGDDRSSHRQRTSILKLYIYIYIYTSRTRLKIAFPRLRALFSRRTRRTTHRQVFPTCVNNARPARVFTYRWLHRERSIFERERDAHGCSLDNLLTDGVWIAVPSGCTLCTFSRTVCFLSPSRSARCTTTTSF